MFDILKQLEQEKEYLIGLRRVFHEHPEPGLQEFHTAERIEAELNDSGIPCSRIGKTGVLGTIHGTGTGSGIVVLRADIDALPIQETNDIPYRSQTEGVMHACGHDAHTACLLGAARLLAEHRDQFGGEIRLIFQPAEEIGQGADDFIRAGVLKNADRVFGIHTASEVPSGVVGLKPGLNNAAVDHFRIVVHGKSAHVSTPQLGIDALYIASQIVVSIQALVTRLTSPTEPVIIGIGKMEAGTTYNALAETAVLEGTTRTISQESRERIRLLIDRTVQNTADIYCGSAQTVWTGICSALINDPGVCIEAEQMIEKSGIGLQVITDRELSLGGDNFAEFLLHVPGAYAYLGTGNPDLPDTLHAPHNGNFNIDENMLVPGAALYAGYALSRLSGTDRLR